MIRQYFGDRRQKDICQTPYRHQNQEKLIKYMLSVKIEGTGGINPIICRPIQVIRHGSPTGFLTVFRPFLMTYRILFISVFLSLCCAALCCIYPDFKTRRSQCDHWTPETQLGRIRSIPILCSDVRPMCMRVCGGFSRNPSR